MTDTSGADEPIGPAATSGLSPWLIGGLVAGTIALIIALVFAFSGDDDDDETVVTVETTTTTPTETTVAPETTPPETTPPETAPPETTPPETAPPEAAPPETTIAPAEFMFTIEDIDDEGAIPIEFTCDGDNDPPIVTIDSVPAGVAQFVMVVDDPDAPSADPFVHWVVYDIPAETTEFTDAEDDLTYGTTDAGVVGWFGPCPPPGDGPHMYVFTLFGLGQELDLEPELDGRALREEIDNDIVAETMITASYERAD